MLIFNVACSLHDAHSYSWYFIEFIKRSFGFRGGDAWAIRRFGRSLVIWETRELSVA